MGGYQYISHRLKSAQWGSKVVSDLADYLKRQNPKRRGFGKRHLYNMVKFYETYCDEVFICLTGELPIPEFVQSRITQLCEPMEPMPNLVALVPFMSHLEIVNRCKSYEEHSTITTTDSKAMTTKRQFEALTTSDCRYEDLTLDYTRSY